MTDKKSIIIDGKSYAPDYSGYDIDKMFEEAMNEVAEDEKTGH